MRFVISLMALFVLSNLTFAQAQLHTKSRKAIQLYKEARELDSLGNYYESEPLLREAIKKDQSFDEAHLLLFITLMKRGDVRGATGILEFAKGEVEQPFSNRMLLELATFYWSNGRYEDAHNLSKSVGEKVHGTSQETATLVKESIDFSKASKSAPERIDFQELPNPINLFSSQYFPSLTSDGAMVFTGRDRGRRGEHEDLFISRLIGNKWEEPKSLSDSINTPQFNEGTASISADGLSIVFTGCNRPEGKGSCDLYISYFEHNEWTKPENLGEGINTEYWESQPSLSQDGRQLYFVSARPTGLGGQDLWVSDKVEGKWTNTRNLGSTINTKLDDCSPFIHPDGETLFYATRGKVGLGGYDLYKTQILSDGWMEPQNLGFPINTFENQVGYTLGLDGWAYYSDNNLVGQTKLYRFKMPGHLLPERKLDLFSGLVRDGKSNEPLSADVYLTDLKKDSTIVQTQSKSDGRFSFIPPNLEINYMVYAKRKGYNLYKRALNEIAKEGGKYLIKLKPIAVNDKVILNNILFEINSADLDVQAKKELQIAIRFLQDNPTVEVEIGGHTDGQGEEDYNLQLSSARAKTVYDYFIEHGISTTRLTHKGYGEGRPIDAQAKSENSALNRRIELTIKLL